MKTIRTRIKYDGPALAGKSMDVADLAPSLIALSELIKTANYQFNGDRAGVKVLVNANLDQNCFELFIDLSQTVWESISNLIADDRVATIKDIAEWIGIIGGTGISLYKLIKLLKGKTVEGVNLIQNDGRNNIQIHINGSDNNLAITHPITLNQHVYELYKNKAAREHAVNVLKPLTKDGYDRLEFYDDEVIYESFSKTDVPSLKEGDLPEIDPQNIIKSKIRTVVRIRKAAYEGTSKWTLVYKKAIEATMDDADWLARFQSNAISAPPGSALDVDMEETVITNNRGEQIEEPLYRVTKVYAVTLPTEQISFLTIADKKDAN